MGLAALYAATAGRGRIDWMLVISGPLAVVGALVWWSWRRHHGLHPAARRRDPRS
jgi:hypothetical protein